MISTSLRPRGYLHWFVLVLVLLALSVGLFFVRQRQSLVCAPEASASWRLTYADGDNISKFMWSIKPADKGEFISCLEDKGYDVKLAADTGEITAFDGGGQTISNTVGDGFVQSDTFYKW